MPLHTWLPLAHPVAPAPFSALMSGLMVKVALYGLIRVAVRVARHAAALARARRCSPSGLLSALGGVLWALLQHDLKRLLAYSTIENVGIIVHRARRLDPDRRSRCWSALAFAAALLHTANHAVFKVLLFLGAGRDRARRRHPRPRPPRRPGAPDAVDRRGLRASAARRSPACRR